MKTLLTLFFLFFSSLLLADEISDFQIGGMSIGESALDYFSREELEDNKELNWYDTTLYTPISELYLSSSEIYESFQIAVKTNDVNFEIVNISGFIFYENDIYKCYEQLDNISNDVKKLFNDVVDLGKSSFDHPYDKSGESKITDIELVSNDGGRILIQCYDWSENYPYVDSLRINIMSEEYKTFVDTAYD